jgi:hypothetical protein
VELVRAFSNGEVKDCDLRWGIPLGREEGRFDLFLERDLDILFGLMDGGHH